ncbi:MAG TPA: cytochrome b/b6 domain-containing protein [Longimicrobiales bacterium]|nr:cytochrome b/b6 domain-containing protein [Longimicrobiales bacterium]
MELWRRAQNPWGQDILIGVSWDLMWAALAASALFLVGHWVWLRMRGGAHAAAPTGPVPPGVPERIARHSVGARLFHWTMSAAMLVLLVTAFVPVMGLEIPSWVTVHWIAGVVLIVSIAYHIVHAIGWQDFWSMMSVGPATMREGVAHLRHVISSKAPEPPKAGKYPFDHKMYHHVIVVVAFAAMITGVIMMMRIDTPFWTRNPYVISDQAVGVVFSIHGLAGVALILLIASHIYFALRPEKHWITWSMIRGWVDREHYLAHHDPAKWAPVPAKEPVPHGTASGALADSSVSAPREDE